MDKVDNIMAHDAEILSIAYSMPKENSEPHMTPSLIIYMTKHIATPTNYILPRPLQTPCGWPLLVEIVSFICSMLPGDTATPTPSVITRQPLLQSNSLVSRKLTIEQFCA